MNSRTLDGMNASIKLVDRALRLAPDDALGFAAAATARTVLASYGSCAPTELMKGARSAAVNALRVDGGLADARRSRGAVALFYEWDWQVAGRELELSVRLNPMDASARQMLSIWYLASNRPEEALQAARAAEALQPAAAILAANTGWILYFAGRFQEAIAHLEALIRRQPQFWRAYVNLAWALTATGHSAEAIQPAEVGVALHPNYATGEAVRAYTYASAGHAEVAETILKTLQRRYGYVSPYWTAIVKIAMGSVDDALTDLRRAAEDREWYLITANWEPAFNPIRHDDRFQTIVRTSRPARQALMSAATVRLPRTAKDIFSLAPVEWLLYNGVIHFARGTGLWRRPVAASGDIETMSLRDKIYWLYKAQFPIDKARKGSGLEQYFARLTPSAPALPADFTPVREICLSAAGDLMTHPFLRNSAESLYESVADDIFGADVSMANLECVVSPNEQPAFHMRSTVAPPLCYGIDDFSVVKGVAGRQYSFLSTACNHSLDCGEAGVEATLDTLRAEAVAWHGTNASEADSHCATVIESKGFRLGLISHTFGLNGKRPPPEKLWIVNRTDLNGKRGKIDLSQIRRQIRFCRDKDVDVIVAMLHWGMEHEYYPTPDQVDVAARSGRAGYRHHLRPPRTCYSAVRVLPYAARPGSACADLLLSRQPDYAFHASRIPPE